MARATRFPVEAFERDRLPEVCILSGEPTGDRLKAKASSRPAVGWLLLVGIVPYVIAQALLTKTASGTLPLSEDVYLILKARRRDRRPFHIAGVTLLVAVLAASPLAAVALGLLAVVVMVIGEVYATMRDPLTGLRLDSSGRWIELPNAADQFADTVSALVKTGAL